ncbi:MAG: 50S ribosomal protein L11 methyltransferase [Gammaproteobacteria bacterium]|nr:50S ribosomal protein L11 methyltransferase [Gammaproteobacteria bacterium]
MPWNQLLLECNAADGDALSDLLAEAGAEAVTLLDAADQPIFEPALGTTPLWDRTRINGLFSADADMDGVVAELARRLAPTPLPPYRIERLEDQDWNRAWMDRFQPMRFGERLWIVPSWHAPADPQAVNILLDPGMAFGTGTHATTRLCLEWLDSHAPMGKRVIDYGCGSGILAIAAARLGATTVWATDNDPQALLATRENAERNAVSEVLVTTSPEQAPVEPADVLIANILAGPLMILAERFAALVRPGGDVVLSGILHEQAEEVRTVYQQWFDMAPATVLEDWVRLEGRRR